jgi:methionyl-tRNA synthetase
VHLEKEESYFFRLSKYADKLLELYEKNPNFISPKSRMNEMVNNFIKPGLKDLCVSRTSFSWGVKLDFDPKHVAYVWIDALSNYITALGYLGDDDSNFRKFWPADVHMTGKEITRFHTIVWPAILMALGLPLPKQVYGHGWLNFYGDKMSKSKGNVAYPLPLVERYGVDAVRYYLLREIPFGSDGSYTDEGFLTRINTDLCNGLGNLVSRTTAMIYQYFGGTIPMHGEYTELDKELIDTAVAALPEVKAHMDALNAPDALVEIFKIVGRANKYIDETTPWTLFKAGERERLATVMYCLAESIRIVAVLLNAFLPTTSQRIFDKLGLGKVDDNFDSIVEFGGLTGTEKVTKGENLFNRIDIEKELPLMKELNQTAAVAAPVEAAPVEKPAEKPEITIDDFAKIDLCTAKVLECVPVEKSDKLLCFQLQVGDEVRQVVSGIAQYYKPEYLVGKTVVLVKNLKPVKLRGVMSNGMILCAADDNNVIFVTPEADIESGKVVR